MENITESKKELKRALKLAVMLNESLVAQVNNQTTYIKILEDSNVKLVQHIVEVEEELTKSRN